MKQPSGPTSLSNFYLVLALLFHAFTRTLVKSRKNRLDECEEVQRPCLSLQPKSIYDPRESRFFFQILYVQRSALAYSRLKQVIAYFVPRTSSTLAGKRARYPGELVCEVPHSDSNAALYRVACRYDRFVIRLLLSEQRRSSRKRHANIQLCDCHLNAQLDERFNVLRDVGWQLADDEVGLEADTVDRNTLFLQRFDESLVGCGFYTWTFDVEVVGVEFGVRVRFACGVESGGDELGPARIEEDVLSEGTVVIEDLVDYIPCVL